MVGPLVEELFLCDFPKYEYRFATKVSICSGCHSVYLRDLSTAFIAGDHPDEELNLSYDVGGGGGLYGPPPILYLFFYSKSLPQTKPLDPHVNS